MSHLKRILKKNGPDIPLEQALGILKSEIIEEVRALAGGLKISIYDLVEKGKEMIVLEEKILDEAKSRASKENLMAEF